MFQAYSSIFFTIKYTYLRKITDFLLFRAKITRFDFFVFKVNLFVASQLCKFFSSALTVCSKDLRSLSA